MRLFESDLDDKSVNTPYQESRKQKSRKPTEQGEKERRTGLVA